MTKDVDYGLVPIAWVHILAVPLPAVWHRQTFPHLQNKVYYYTKAYL